MFADLRKAAGIVRDPAFFWVVVKALGLTLLLFTLLYSAMRFGFAHLPVHAAWLKAAADWAASALLVLLVFFLGAPVAALFASLFLEEIADAVEERFYPADPKPPGVRFWTALWTGLRLFFWVLLLNLLLLPFNILLPGFGTAFSLLVNGWLLGREYFELVALRHLSPRAADTLRKSHRAGVWWAGIVLAVLAMIPFVNLFAPLFGAAFMVHVFKRYFHEGRPV